jgi:hypothetical protein
MSSFTTYSRSEQSRDRNKSTHLQFIGHNDIQSHDSNDGSTDKWRILHVEIVLSVSAFTSLVRRSYSLTSKTLATYSRTITPAVCPFTTYHTTRLNTKDTMVPKIRPAKLKRLAPLVGLILITMTIRAQIRRCWKKKSSVWCRYARIATERCGCGKESKDALNGCKKA